MVNDENQRAYFIELKGSDIIRATQQIDKTVDAIIHNFPEYKIFRRIVYRTGSHAIQSKEVINWKKKHGVNYAKIESRQMDDVISE